MESKEVFLLICGILLLIVAIVGIWNNWFRIGKCWKWSNPWLYPSRAGKQVITTYEDKQNGMPYSTQQ